MDGAAAMLQHIAVFRCVKVRPAAAVGVATPSLHQALTERLLMYTGQVREHTSSAHTGGLHESHFYWRQKKKMVFLFLVCVGYI